MIPLILGAMGAIAIANELFHPDSKKEREIEKYRSGKQDIETTQKNIGNAYEEYYAVLDEDENPRRDEKNYEAYYNKAIAKHEKMQSMSPVEKSNAIRDHAVKAFNSGKISQSQLDNAFDFARQIRG